MAVGPMTSHTVCGDWEVWCCMRGGRGLRACKEAGDSVHLLHPPKFSRQVHPCGTVLAASLFAALRQGLELATLCIKYATLCPSSLCQHCTQAEALDVSVRELISLYEACLHASPAHQQQRGDGAAVSYAAHFSSQAQVVLASIQHLRTLYEQRSLQQQSPSKKGQIGSFTSNNKDVRRFRMQVRHGIKQHLFEIVSKHCCPTCSRL